MSVAIHSHTSILTTQGGFEKLEFQRRDHPKIALYKLGSFDSKAIKKAKAAIQQEINAKNLKYKGDLASFERNIKKRPYLVKSAETLKLVSAKKIGGIHRYHKDYLGAIRYYHLFPVGNNNTEAKECIRKKLRLTYLKLPIKVKYALQLLQHYHVELESAKEAVFYHGIGIASYFIAEYGASQKEFYYQQAKWHLERCVEISGQQSDPHDAICSEAYISQIDMLLKKNFPAIGISEKCYIIDKIDQVTQKASETPLLGLQITG